MLPQTTVQEGAQERGGARLHQDDHVHGAGVPAAHGDVSQGQVHLQHEAVGTLRRVLHAARTVRAPARVLHRCSIPGTYHFELLGVASACGVRFFGK